MHGLQSHWRALQDPAHPAMREHCYEGSAESLGWHRADSNTMVTAIPCLWCCGEQLRRAWQQRCACIVRDEA